VNPFTGGAYDAFVPPGYGELRNPDHQHVEGPLNNRPDSDYNTGSYVPSEEEYLFNNGAMSRYPVQQPVTQPLVAYRSQTAPARQQELPAAAPRAPAQPTLKLKLRRRRRKKKTAAQAAGGV
jgi:hypothetical protein